MIEARRARAREERKTFSSRAEAREGALVSVLSSLSMITLPLLVRAHCERPPYKNDRVKELGRVLRDRDPTFKSEIEGCVSVSSVSNWSLLHNSGTL